MNQQDNHGANQQQPLIANSIETESLADLPLTAAQAEGTKAGIVGGTSAAAGEFPYIISFQNTASGAPPKPPASPGLTSNHNETVAEDDAVGDEAIADLPVTDAEEVRGGTGGRGGGTGKATFHDLSFTTSIIK